MLEDKETPTNFKGLVPVVFDKLPKWHEETPHQIKVGAVMDACQVVRNRIKVKIRNLIDELHKKIAHFLVTNFDIIFLPTFETKQMTKRGKRKLRKRSVRQILTLSHWTFKAFLKQKAREYGVRVIDVCEAWTSKTVSWTGELITNLGGSKVIKSSEGHCMDRDLNGARGIFIKNVARALTVLPPA